jgi:hypothetical protein
MAKPEKRSRRGFAGFLKKGREVIRLNKRFVFWLAPGVVTFTLAFAGCQKKEEPVPAANPAPAAAPPGNAPAAAGAVAPGSGSSDTGLGSSAATGESKKAEKQDAGTKTF